MAKYRRNISRSELERQAQSAGYHLQLSNDADEETLERMAVFLDMVTEGGVEAPRGVGLYDRTIFDERPGTERVGQDGTTRADYYRYIRARANEIEEALRSGDLDPDELGERISEEAEKAFYWVYTTPGSIATMVHSDNWLAIDEAVDYGLYEFAQAQYFTDLLGRAAFFAVEQDIRETVDVDVAQEDDDWDDEDEDEDDWD